MNERFSKKVDPMPAQTPNEPLVLMYHGLDPGDGRYSQTPPEARAYVLSRSDFLDHLSLLERAGRRLADPAEFHQEQIGRIGPIGQIGLTGAKPLLSPNEVLLTFDDGMLSDYDVAFPILAEKGRRAAFFITTGEVGAKGRVTWEHLREMAAAGMTLGAHGHTHRFLSELGADEQRNELETSRALIQDKTGVAVRMMSLPGGRFRSDTFAAARAWGYTAVFTSSPHPERTCGGVRVIGRIALSAGWGAADGPHETGSQRMRDFLARQSACLAAMRRTDALHRFAQACLGPRTYAWLHRACWRLRAGTVGESSQD
jgi:peptidoglycan/xylan/chitin deacetylase (PgdA/CDA1 family)